MPEDSKPESSKINTGGGTFISGNVATGGGDFIGRDKITVGDVEGSVAAIGAGARAIVTNIQTYIERAKTSVEIVEQADSLARKYLAESVTAYIQRLQKQSETGKLTTSASNPFKSLLEYDLEDAPFFYGRSAAIRQLLERLGRDRLTVIHSESGSGKTSLLKAGLMPRLLSEGHVPVYVRPYQAPVQQAIRNMVLGRKTDSEHFGQDSLHHFLRQITDMLDGQQLFVIVDQFEELFTVQSENDRKSFINELSICLDDDLLPVRWIFAIRGEWLSQLGTFRPPLKNPFANELLLQPLKRQEAREVIQQPALRVGVEFETDLVEQLLDDLGQDRIAPPQLQLVCSTLFENRGNAPRITLNTYSEAGQTRGILRGHLDRVLRRDVPQHQRENARRILETLVTSEKRRALRTREELVEETTTLGVDPGALDQILHQLIESRVLRISEIPGSAGHAYELTHDYLLDEIELDPELQARKAAQELLNQKLAYYERDSLLLSAEEIAIISPHHDAIHFSEPARRLWRESQALANRRRLITRTVILAFFILATTAILVGQNFQRSAAEERANIIATAATGQAEIAETAWAASTRQVQLRATADAESVLRAQAEAQALNDRDEALKQAEIAKANSLAARSELNLEDAPDLASLLAVEAYNIADTFESRNTLLRNLQVHPEVLGHIGSRDHDFGQPSFSADGKRVAALSLNLHESSREDGRAPFYITVWDVESKKPILDRSFDGKESGSVLLSPDGETLIAAGDGISFWDVDTGALVAELPDPQLEFFFPPYGMMAISPDGRLLAVANATSILIWDIQALHRSEPASEIPRNRLNLGSAFSLNDIAFSPDGDTLLTGNDDGKIAFWDLSRDALIAEYWMVGSQVYIDLDQVPEDEAGAPIISVAFRENGYALGMTDGNQARDPVHLWNIPLPLEGDNRLKEFEFVELDCISSVVGNGAISENGEIFACGVGSNIRVWHISSYFCEARPDSNCHSDHLLEISPNDIGSWKRVQNSENYFALSADGSKMGFASCLENQKGNNHCLSGQIDLWVTYPYNPIETVINVINPESLAVSPAGGLMAIGEEGGIRFFAPTGKDFTDITSISLDGVPLTLEFDPTGSLLGAKVCKPYEGEADCAEDTLYIINTSPPLGNDMVERTIPDPPTGRGLAFSGDGGLIASGGNEPCPGVGSTNCRMGEIKVWDVETPDSEPVTLISAEPASLERWEFSPQGRLLASVWEVPCALENEENADEPCRAWEILVWDLHSPGAEPVKLDHAHIGEPDGIWFTAGGSTLITASADRIAFWDTTSFKPSGTPIEWETFGRGFNDVTVSRDGSTLVFGHWDPNFQAQIYQFDVESRDYIGKVTLGSLGQGFGLELSPDGSVLLFRDFFSSYYFLARDLGQPLGVSIPSNSFVITDSGPDYHLATSRNFRFSPDGSYLFNLFDSRVSIWMFDPQDWVRLACIRAGRDLTEEEWIQNMGGLPYRKTCSDILNPP